jgi:hypothetical protein
MHANYMTWFEDFYNFSPEDERPIQTQDWSEKNPVFVVHTRCPNRRDTNGSPWTDEPLGSIAVGSSSEAMALYVRSLFGIAKQLATIGARHSSDLHAVAAFR